MKKPGNCSVCDAADAKYRFKCCRMSFCSPGCFEKHVDCSNSFDSQSQKPLVRPIRKENFDLNLSEDEIMSEDLLRKIVSHSSVSSFLTDETLRSALLRIDSARDRRKAFSRAYEASAKLRELVDVVNAVLGADSQEPSSAALQP